MFDENNSRKGFLSVDAIPPHNIIDEESVTLSISNHPKEENEQCLSDLDQEEILVKLKTAQNEIKRTSKQLKKIQHNYGALKIKNQVISRRLNESSKEGREKSFLVETLKNENQTLILCCMKMVKIFQKQNEGVIDVLFDDLVISPIINSQGNYEDLVNLVEFCENQFEIMMLNNQLDEELEQKTVVMGTGGNRSQMCQSELGEEDQAEIDYGKIVRKLDGKKFSLPVNIPIMNVAEEIGCKSTTSSKFKLKRDKLRLTINCSRDNSNLVAQGKEIHSSSSSQITCDLEQRDLGDFNSAHNFRSFTESRKVFKSNDKRVSTMSNNPNLTSLTKGSFKFKQSRSHANTTSNFNRPQKKDFLLYTQRDSEPVNLKNSSLRKSKITKSGSNEDLGGKSERIKKFRRLNRKLRKAQTRRETPSQFQKGRSRAKEHCSMLNIAKPPAKKNVSEANLNQSSKELFPKRKKLSVLANLMKGTHRSLFKSSEKSPSMVSQECNMGSNRKKYRAKAHQNFKSKDNFFDNNSKKTSRKKRNIVLGGNGSRNCYKGNLSRMITTPAKKREKVLKSKKTSVRKIVDNMKNITLGAKFQNKESNFRKIYNKVSRLEERKKSLKERVINLKTASRKMKTSETRLFGSRTGGLTYKQQMN